VTQMARVFGVMFLIAMIIGVTMSWVFYFRSYDAQFASLGAADLNMSQALYNETLARVAKDMLLMQKQALMQSALDADIVARKAEQGVVNVTLQNDTAARIEGFENITVGLEEEIAGRSANDTYLQGELTNASATITQIMIFNNYSLAEFMIIMSNITDISAEIMAETATRTAEQTALKAQQIILSTSLSILVNQLNIEIATRIAQDQSIETLLTDATYNLITSVNGLPPLNGTIILRSLNPVFVTITNGPAINQVFVTNNGVLTFNNIGPDGAGNVQIIAGQGIILSYPVAHLIQVSAVAGSAIGTNSYYTSSVYPYGQETCWINNAGDNNGAFCNQMQDEVLLRCPVLFLTYCTGNFYCTSGTNNFIMQFESAAGHAIPGWFCGATPVGNLCLAPCTADSDCVASYGSAWKCSAFYSGVRYCQQGNGCNSDESQCSAQHMLPFLPPSAFLPPVLGDSWRCISGQCRKMWCFYDYDCANAYGNGQAWQCWNGRCVGKSIQ